MRWCPNCTYSVLDTFLPALFALHAAAAPDTVPKPSGCNPHWTRGKVKYDMRHFMANYFLMAIGKYSSLFRYFCVTVSDAAYKIIPSSRDEVRAHLKFLGLSDTETRRVRRKYWRTKARYWVPGPETLVQGLTDVYDFFKDLVDPTTGRNFFIADHAKRFRHEMSYVRRGDLSDPPGVAMYTKVGEYKVVWPGSSAYAALPRWRGTICISDW